MVLTWGSPGMAIQTIDANNLSEYVAERTAKGSEMTTSAQVTEKVKGIANAKNPVLATGAETVDSAPDPGSQEPTAKAADKAKAGTDPAVQKRIDQLTREKREAEELFESEYNARLEAERRLRDLDKAEKPVVVEDVLKRPSPKDFTDQDTYDAAMEAYETKREAKLAERIRAEESQRQAMERQNELMKARIDRARESIPDFIQVIEAADRVKVPVPGHVQAAIVESDFGPEIAYHLAKNPDEQKRIFALTPAKALLELGKIENTFSAEVKETKATPTVETTRAPAPVTSVRSMDAAVSLDTRTATNFQDYKRLRTQEIRKRR